MPEPQDFSSYHLKMAEFRTIALELIRQMQQKRYLLRNPRLTNLERQTLQQALQQLQETHRHKQVERDEFKSATAQALLGLESFQVTLNGSPVTVSLASALDLIQNLKAELAPLANEIEKLRAVTDSLNPRPEFKTQVARLNELHEARNALSDPLFLIEQFYQAKHTPLSEDLPSNTPAPKSPTHPSPPPLAPPLSKDKLTLPGLSKPITLASAFYHLQALALSNKDLKKQLTTARRKKDSELEAETLAQMHQNTANAKAIRAWLPGAAAPLSAFSLNLPSTGMVFVEATTVSSIMMDLRQEIGRLQEGATPAKTKSALQEDTDQAILLEEITRFLEAWQSSLKLA